MGAGGLGSQLGRNFQPGAHLAGGEGRREVGEPEVGVLEGAQSQGPVNVARMRSWGSRHGFWYQWAWSGVVDMISCTDGRSLWAGGWPQWAWPGAGGRGLGQVGVAWGRWARSGAVDAVSGRVGTVSGPFSLSLSPRAAKGAPSAVPGVPWLAAARRSLQALPLVLRRHPAGSLRRAPRQRAGRRPVHPVTPRTGTRETRPGPAASSAWRVSLET